jgi:hypothetical protein
LQLAARVVCVAALALAWGAAASASPLLDGRMVQGEWIFPALGTVYQSVDVTVGPALEIPGTAGGFDVDLSDTKIVFSHMTAPDGYSSGTFNGWHFSDFLGTIDAFGSVTIDPATNMAGFDASRIDVSADDIFVNFRGLGGDTDTVVVLHIAPVPEPSSASLVLLGGALLAARRRPGVRPRKPSPVSPPA